MHTAELLDVALKVIKQQGVRVRLEWLTAPGGLCEFKGKRWLFLDLGATPGEQLDITLDALRTMPEVQRVELPPELRRLLNWARSA